MGSQEIRKVVYQGVFVLGLGGNIHLFGGEQLDQVRIGGRVTLEGLAVGELAADVLALQDYFGDLIGLDQVDKLAVIDGGFAPGVIHV